MTETSTGAAATATVGTYPIVPSAATCATGLSNYTISYVNGTLTVNPAALTITANNASKTYGHAEDLQQHRVHDNRPGQRRHVSSVTETSTGAAATATVGTVHHRPQRRDGHAGLSNYTITYANGTLTVNPAPLTITANNDEQDLRPD